MPPTREEILNEPAGPRLNAWVGEYIFGLHTEILANLYTPLREYSQNIAHAWEVRNKVKTWIFSERLKFKKYLQLIISKRIGLEKVLIHPKEICLQMEPEDICRAALHAKLDKE